jgi:CRP-like cAMP-binding protein
MDELDPRKQLDRQNPRILNREVYFKGKDIIRQGDEGYRAYYIEKGSVEVLIDDGKHQLKIAELGPGDIFGEMSLINHEPRSATVRALYDTTVTIIARDEIEGKIKRIQDEAIRALINVLAERLRGATKGQLDHYSNLADFQDKITGVVDRAHKGIDETKRAAFRDEVQPLIDELSEILIRYQGEDR